MAAAAVLPITVIDVWDKNLEAEVEKMGSLIEGYPFLATDTEFPGKPFEKTYNSNYTNMKANVDKLKVIQLGITLFNEDGNLPVVNGEHLVWQFNFCEFDISKDEKVTKSIEMLRDAGTDFQKNMEFGISAKRFAEVLMSSGLVSNIFDETKLVTFHGGYDCGYWVRLLTGKELPDNEAAFYEKAKAYFPVFYDLKYVASCENINYQYLGLVGLAELLKVERKVGNYHQAGPDSLLTSGLYQALKNKLFANSSMLHSGVLYFR